MNRRQLLGLMLSHVAVGAVGFGAGVYTLPLLIAPDAPAGSAVRQVAGRARFNGRFVRDLPGSDALHWGDGEVFLAADAVAFEGRLAPGPDYKLYLSPTFVQTEAEFERDKLRMLRAGDVRTFDNFLVTLPAGTDLTAYTTVVVWCETFREFISAARYR
jgi:hypothetical protein